MTAANAMILRAFGSLNEAISTARAATEQAERALKANGDPAIAARSILHALVWGHANAVTQIESALASIEDAHAARAHEAVAHAQAVAIADAPYPPLSHVTTDTVPTRQAAYYLNRAPQTLRAQACMNTGPIVPRRIGRILAWPVDELRRVVGGKKAKA